MAVLLHRVAGLEDVLDDPEAFLLVDVDHLELVAVADLDEGQVGGAEVQRLGRSGLGHGHE